MSHRHGKTPGVLAAVALCALIFIPPSGTSAPVPKVPVVSLKTFVSVPTWRLDITWHAKDAFENADCSAKLDMTATARFILEQSDKEDAWGHWHVEKARSGTIAMTSFLVNKHDHSRTEWRPTGAILDAGATFDVGGLTPGYQLVCATVFGAKIINPLFSGDGLVTLLNADISGDRPVFCTGPLPASGTTIHGSLVIPMAVPLFGAAPLPNTRVGIEFVLQPDDTLAPLVPTKK
ncbi:MAG TPA: hypothetical protein PK435_14920 [Thermoanaerobaculaceae bacterium]|nr:hypothetical protein [Thermoanaerobaculaceae bacterium]